MDQKYQQQKSGDVQSQSTGSAHQSMDGIDRRTSISHRLKTVFQRALKKEAKLDNVEAMINDNALKLLQQKEFLCKQNALHLDTLIKETRFSRRELKWLYSGWKVACTYGSSLEGAENYGSSCLSSAYYGIINESQFQQIYAQFFPYGGDATYYAKYVFHTMFEDALTKNGGFITFSDYAISLSNLLRGSLEDKINFIFRLYDLNNDNVLTIDEMSRIFFAMYRLLGDNVDVHHDQSTYDNEAMRIFGKIDTNRSGYITQDQFMDYCKREDYILKTIDTLEISICSNA